MVRFWPLGTLIRASHRANGSFHAPEAREYFAFSVSDRGPGIDPGATASVFDPFYMAGPDGKRADVGLSIARDLVERHGGRIWAENNPGGGATFTVVLPKRQ
jgi:signal transduction histidine kinase